MGGGRKRSMEKSDIVVWYHGLWVDAISGESWERVA